MKLSLLVMTPGKQEGKAIDIKLPQFLVGRDPQCQLRPASALISKRHCAVLQRDGKAFIRDFGSTNGTFVNEERVEGERELHDGDQLKIGPIEFVVKLEADEKTNLAKTPAPATKPVTQAKPAATPKPPTTPVPATTKKPEPAKSGGGGGEDDIAAMLLSIDDGDAPAGASGGVPDGSTVFDLKIPPEVAAAAPGGAQPGAAGAKDAKPKPQSDTRSAAANILEQMLKRPRNKPT